MLKNELRLNFLQLRQNLPDTTYQTASKAIAERVFHLPVSRKTRFHVFLPIRSKKEIDTAYLQAELGKRGKEIVVPRVVGEGKLKHYLATPETRFATSRWGIPEPIGAEEVSPESLDVVFVPLLAFDAGGHRVGYGGGYYDRFLQHCREDTLRIGLSFFGPVPAIEDVHEGDLPLHYAVTPETVYTF